MEPTPCLSTPEQTDAEQVIRGYFADLAAGNATAVRARFATDYVLEIVGEGSWPLGGAHGGERLRELMGNVRRRFPGGVTLSPLHFTASGDRVVVEATAHGIRLDGREYRNDYVFVFIVRDGLIHWQREFNDIILANDVLCGPMKDDGKQGGSG